MSGFSTELVASYIRAGYPALYLVTHEELRAKDLLREAASSLGLLASYWTCTRGWDHSPDDRDPVQAVQAVVSRTPEGILCVLVDFHPYLDDPVVVRAVRDAIPTCKATGRHLVFLGPVLKVPPELEKDVAVLEMPLPDRDYLGRILDYVSESAGVPVPAEMRERLVAALSGMTASEAENAAALALVRRKDWDEEAVRILHDEKAQLLRRTGILEYYPARETLDDVGGLDLLKAWLRKRARAFTDEARAFGLEPPRGVLLLGVQGCGKSLTAKATARTWGMPLLRLDMGRVFGSLVGESEANLRTALRVAEAMAPCVLWVDEIEKGTAGVSASGMLDSGVTARVVGSLLTWLQERDPARPVFVAATANRIDATPPELLRKGRFDEIFFVDLPDEQERVEILRIHLRKRGRDPSRFDLEEVARASEGFSGAELEQAVADGLYAAFDEGRDLETPDLLEAVRSTVPLSRTRSEEIRRLREWATQHARPASSRKPPAERHRVIRL